MSSGVVATIPWRPSMEMRSVFGFRAAAKGVRPSSCGSGKSAPPSAIIITYFITGVSVHLLASTSQVEVVDHQPSG